MSNKLLNLVRDFRQQSTADAKVVTYEVVDPNGNPIAARPRESGVHYRIYTGVNDPDESCGAKHDETA
jgi:hypothetical protein